MIGIGRQLASGLKRPVWLGGVVAGALLTGLGWWFLPPPSLPMTRGALPQQAYLWQRQWTPNVRDAAIRAGSGQIPLAGLCVAHAEISAGAASLPGVERTAGLDWALLARSREPVGFAVRVRAFPGEVAVGREPFPTLRRVVGELCAEASAAGMQPAEIQIDFDCPTARLRGFASWLRELQRAFPGQTFRFTALPAWLRSRDFAPLARTTGSYVLQVHWLEKPGLDGRPPTTLCDPAQARAAVERAARLGVPFRVALPTYGYRLVLDARGKLLAAAGEGAALEAARPPPDGTTRTLLADPAALADLIRDWQASRPQALQGVIWYRWPVAGDRLNWAPRTLLAVMGGRHPQPKLGLQFNRPDNDGLWELRLCNEGDADASLPSAITVHCPAAPLAADGVGGFALAQNGAFWQDLVFTLRPAPGATPRTLPPEARLVFGWVRLAAGATGPALTGTWTPAAALSTAP